MRNIAIALILLLCLQSCRTQKDILYFQNINKVIDNELPDNFTEPTIQVGDDLSIIVNGQNSELTNQFNLNNKNGNNTNRNSFGYLVDSEGNIEFPMLGTIYAKGKTRYELSSLIKQMIEKDKLESVIVNVRINNYRVVMLGEFDNPGIKTFTTDKVSIMDAIGSAGNMKFSAIRDSVLVIRNVNGVRTKGYLNLLNAESMNSPYFYLKQNDIVYAMPTKSRAMSFNNLPINVALSAIGFALTIIALFK